MTTIPIQEFDPRKPFFDKGGQMLRDFFVRLNDLVKRTGGVRGEALGPLPDYTLAQIAAGTPSASNNPHSLIYVSDGAGNKFVAVSNGTAWYYLTGTAV